MTTTNVLLGLTTIFGAAVIDDVLELVVLLLVIAVGD